MSVVFTGGLSFLGPFLALGIAAVLLVVAMFLFMVALCWDAFGFIAGTVVAGLLVYADVWLAHRCFPPDIFLSGFLFFAVLTGMASMYVLPVFADTRHAMREGRSYDRRR